MTKHAKDMLKYLTDPQNTPNGSISMGSLCTAYSELSGFGYYRIVACLRYLANNGYVRFIDNYIERQQGIELEHKGYDYKEIEIIEAKDFFRRSVITPILVTIATNLLIYGTKALLPLILQWVSDSLG